MLDLIQEATASTQLVISLPIVDVDAGTAVETSSISVTSRNLQDLGISYGIQPRGRCIAFASLSDSHRATYRTTQRDSWVYKVTFTLYFTRILKTTRMVMSSALLSERIHRQHFASHVTIMSSLEIPLGGHFISSLPWRILITPGVTSL